jgi:hypothetical protein
MHSVPHEPTGAPSFHIPSHTNPLVLPPSTFRPTRTHWCSLLPHSIPHEPTGAPSFHIPSHTNPLVFPPSSHSIPHELTGAPSFLAFYHTRAHWCSLLPRIRQWTQVRGLFGWGCRCRGCSSNIAEVEVRDSIQDFQLMLLSVCLEFAII